MKQGFDSELYLKIQSEKIQERINMFEKLYLEFGGKYLMIFMQQEFYLVLKQMLK